MSRTEPASAADVLEILMSAVNGVFPALTLEALIARLETGK